MQKRIIIEMQKGEKKKTKPIIENSNQNKRKETTNFWKKLVEKQQQEIHRL